MNQNNIGEIIKNRRLELKLTLEDIGKAVGVSKSTVKKWESGFIKNIKRDKISNLAKILQISPVILICGNDSPTTINNGIVGNHNSHNIIKIGPDILGEIESEILTLCKSMNIKNKNSLLSYAYKLTEEQKTGDSL